MFAVVFLLLLPLAGFAGQTQFVGGQVCAGCHKSIAGTQATTAMARTWQGDRTTLLAPVLTESHSEGPAPDILYKVRRTSGAFDFETLLPGQPVQTFPVWTTMGGSRHGLSFLFRVPALDGLQLDRAPLVEGRYLHYAPHERLELSPGFPEEKPGSFETALGRVLTPGFERKCLACHGEPRRIGSHTDSGVTCENCHGAGAAHLQAIAASAPARAILNPERLPVAERMQACSQCHSGFSVVEDPLPDDLLISDQVTALKNSECWRQSSGNITCTGCHDPHQDAPKAALVKRSETVCVTCHSNAVPRHAALCPVNRNSGCVGCHMPEEMKAPLHVADHWIRVQGIRVHDRKTEPVSPERPEWASQVKPLHLWLRMIVMKDRSQAAGVRQSIAGGGSFFDAARAVSTDQPSAQNGGFLGDLTPAQMDTAWTPAALKLKQGELSPVFEAHGQFVILQRMPRNFREAAEARFNQAMAARQAGQQQQAAAGFLEALKLYPRLLRALTYLGMSYGEAGNPQTGAAILSIAARLYPQDAGAHFNLGVALGAMGGSGEAAEYRRALEIDPDLTTAYLNLGASFYAKGQYQEAISAYRQGIHANPLIASLHYSLGVALQRQGDGSGAQREFALAQKIDPRVGK